MYVYSLQSMHNWLVHIIGSTCTMNSNEENTDCCYVLSGALFAYIAQHFDFSLKIEEYQNIAELLQLQPDKFNGDDDHRSCLDYDMLSKSIPHKDFKLVSL